AGASANVISFNVGLADEVFSLSSPTGACPKTTSFRHRTGRTWTPFGLPIVGDCDLSVCRSTLTANGEYISENYSSDVREKMKLTMYEIHGIHFLAQLLSHSNRYGNFNFNILSFSTAHSKFCYTLK